MRCGAADSLAIENLADSFDQAQAGRAVEREKREIARYVSTLGPIVLRLDVDSSSEVIVQKESNEAPRSQVLRNIPIVPLLSQKLLKVFSTPGAWGQPLDMRLNCELCFEAHFVPSLLDIYT